MRSSSGWSRTASSAAAASAEALEEFPEPGLERLRGRRDPDGGRRRRARPLRGPPPAPVVDDHVQVHAAAGEPVLARHRDPHAPARVQEVARLHDAVRDLVGARDRVEFDRRGEQRRRHVRAQHGRDGAADPHHAADEREGLPANDTSPPDAELARARQRVREIGGDPNTYSPSASQPRPRYAQDPKNYHPRFSGHYPSTPVYYSTPRDAYRD